jgi:hypothetical protein
MVCGGNELHPSRGIYRGIGDKIYVFLRFLFLDSKWSKLEAPRASTRGPNRSRHLALTRYSRPSLIHISVSPASSPGHAPAQARLGRYRPLSSDDGSVARRLPPTALLPARSRLTLAPTPARTGTNLMLASIFFAQTLCSNFMKLVLFCIGAFVVQP